MQTIYIVFHNGEETTETSVYMTTINGDALMVYTTHGLFTYDMRDIKGMSIE